MNGFAAQRLMELEVGGLTSAGYGEERGVRLAQRNGYCNRDWETRAGTVERDTTAGMIDSTVIRAHHCAVGKKRDQEAKGLSRSRGGFMTKLHARCDGQGRPLCFVLTPGQAHDVKGFGPLFGTLSDRVEALLANKDYDTYPIREELAKANVEAVIPTKSNRRIPIPHDREKYR